ncbi:MAG: type II secretion system protein [Campylobacterota bacterium]|nr:type II secretion system protein [Campylobacterota bacterium]
MIELIFVIVIIGILASVAIPKLAATRDDAKVSALATNVANAANEMAAYTVSRGDTKDNFSAMSRAVEAMIAQNDAVQVGNILNIKMNTVSDCLQLSVVSSQYDSNLTIAYGDAGSDTLCKSLQDTIFAEDYPIPLKGIRIIR